MEGAAAAMSACGTGLAGRATEAVVSFDGPDDMMSLSPMLEVQPAKARLARTIADVEAVGERPGNSHAALFQPFCPVDVDRLEPAGIDEQPLAEPTEAPDHGRADGDNDRDRR